MAGDDLNTGETEAVDLAPEPDRRLVYVLCALFLAACCAYGYGSTKSRFGVMSYNSNVLLAPSTMGMVRSIGPFRLRGSTNIQLIFQVIHPRPHDAPDQFVFDWALLNVSGPRPELAASGTIGFTGESIRKKIDFPPHAIVPLPDGLIGDFRVTVSPRGIGDFPDMDIYVMRAHQARVVAFAIATGFAGLFLALLLVTIRRHRLALAAWRDAGESRRAIRWQHDV